jgi:arabinose-5-phosphate isomerase
VLVTGAGTSHAVAQRLAHLLSCAGTPALCIDAGDGLHGGSGAIKDGDVVYVISKGGQSKEINQFARIAKERGALIVAQTETADSPLGMMSDAVLTVKTDEDVDPFGMVATGSSLVNAAAGDALCAVLLKLRGYTREAFSRTHPGGAVGKKIEESGP